jgi:hypothetical protein
MEFFHHTYPASFYHLHWFDEPHLCFLLLLLVVMLMMVSLLLCNDFEFLVQLFFEHNHLFLHQLILFDLLLLLHFEHLQVE